MLGFGFFFIKKFIRLHELLTFCFFCIRGISVFSTSHFYHTVKMHRQYKFVSFCIDKNETCYQLRYKTGSMGLG